MDNKLKKKKKCMHLNLEKSTYLHVYFENIVGFFLGFIHLGPVMRDFSNSKLPEVLHFHYFEEILCGEVGDWMKEDEGISQRKVCRIHRHR